MLADGAILAVKGIGGYHLACDAASEEAVGALRSRKQREEKPFALMATGIEEARTLVELTPAEEELLTRTRAADRDRPASRRGVGGPSGGAAVPRTSA